MKKHLDYRLLAKMSVEDLEKFTDTWISEHEPVTEENPLKPHTWEDSTHYDPKIMEEILAMRKKHRCKRATPQKKETPWSEKNMARIEARRKKK